MEMTILLPLVTFFVIFLSKGAESTTFTFTNNCPYTVWPATLAASSSSQLSTTGFQLNNGTSTTLDAPSGWTGRMWARRVCTSNSSGKFSCESADCGSGQVACNGASSATPATLVEFSLNYGNGGEDIYDVSLVDGFNLPVSVTPEGGSGLCGPSSCPADIDSACPSEVQFTVGGAVLGCRSACDAFNTDEYCCTGAYGAPGTCPPSTYEMFFRNECPHAYLGYSDDDQTSTFVCMGANYVITFCP